ncbi:MAG: polysaccharide biosynthesis C-terminal domain-containing protein, partial [Pseudomonadales bacterium]|nr:polysaccharide biosynthesis C-terminal domain-containing protein [Pseudomonadales bacterium]
VDVIATPKLVEYWTGNEIEKFKSLAGAFLSLSMLFSIVLAIVVFFGGEYLSNIAVGFTEEKKERLSESFIWILPVVIFYIPFHVLGAVFRAVRNFSIVYRAEFIYTIIICLTVANYKDTSMVLFWSMNLGLIGATLYLLISSRKYLKIDKNIISDDLRNCLRIAPSLFLLQVVHYSYVLVDRMYISYLDDGSVGALAYGFAVAQLLQVLMFFEGGFMTIFAEKKHDISSKNEVVNHLLSFVIYIGVPCGLVLGVWGEGIIGILLQRGLFSDSSTGLVADGLLGFSLVVIPLLIMGPIDQIFQVENRLSVIVWRNIVGLVLNIILNAYFIFILNWGVFGVALATSLSYWGMILSALISLRKLNITVTWGKHLMWSGWLLCISVLAILSCYRIFGVENSLEWMIVQIIFYGLVIFFGGYFYWGHERVLIRETLHRLIPVRFKMKPISDIDKRT